MLYGIYNILLTVALVVGVPLIPLFLLLGERYRLGLFERLGFYSRGLRESMRGARPVWIHAASVGEVVAAKQLVDALKVKFPDRKVILSTFTSTGRGAARRSVAADAWVLLPLDHPWFVRRALAVFDPRVFIVIETELWPNLLRACHRRGIPVLLLSGRLSPGSFRYYSFFRPFFSEAVRYLTALGMQSAQDAGRMRRLGADPGRISITGNLKRAARADRGRVEKAPLHFLPVEGRHARRVLVAGSTHRGEEEALLEVFQLLKPGFPDLLMVLAPRHPQRFAEVEGLLKKSGLSYEKKSEMNGADRSAADVVFLDTLGELEAFYSVASVAFVGGSLVAVGGHNVMEPARFRKPVLFGPHMANFARIAEELKRSGGGIEVRGKEDLARELSRLLGDPAGAERAGERAYETVRSDRGVVEGSMELVVRYI
jgi:3-deoxy-D-manno-octulosonic-acid transferase